MAEKIFYSAKKLNGDRITGIIEANDEYHAEILLIEKGLDVISVRAANFFDNLNEQFEGLKEKFTTVGLTDLIVFTRQFATLFSAGIPVLTSLERLRDQTANVKFRKRLTEVVDDIQAGSSLYRAFNKHTDIFPSLYIGMIKVGEEGGVLDIILQRIASILEAQLDTVNRLKTATRYPKMVVGSIICAFVVLLSFVVPKFVGLFAKFKAELPLPTRILIWMNNAFQHYWWLVLMFSVACVLGYKHAVKTDKGKLVIDRIILKLPVLGDLVSKIYIARLVRILGLLYRSGIPIITGFEIVSEVTGNEVFKRELLNIKNSISTGTPINVAVRNTEIFPTIVSDMIVSGEETGLLDEMLFKIADYFDEETDYAIQHLSSAIEPILLVFIAGMILIIALGVFLPMWNMMNVFTH